MTVRNHNWYNSNENRDYPLDDTASALDDAGVRLPQNIITDISLRYPQHLGNYPFVGAVAVTRSVVTVTLQVAMTKDNSDHSFVPLAVISVPIAELTEGRHYPLEAQYPGTAGYIVFGSGYEQIYSGRFSAPSQSLLMPRVSRGYRNLPVSSMAKLYNSTPLTGLVKLLGAAPIEVVKESREVLGIDRDVIVVRLVDDPTAAQANDQSTVNVFQLLSGPCAKRPESRTCGDPQPIQFVNSVAPDCNGVLELEFTGCAAIGKNLDDCGIVIDCSMGLTESCLPPAIPDADGLLPSEFAPAVIPPIPDPDPEPPPSDSISDSIIVIGELPFVTCFRDQISTDFLAVSGQFVFAEDFSPSQPCLDELDPHTEYSLASEGIVSASQRNAIIWTGFDVTTLFRQVTTDVKLMPGPGGARHNGGLIINYRPHSNIVGRYVYYIAEIDYDTQEFQIQRFNGTSFVPVVAVSVPGITLEDWYRISVFVLPGGGSQVSLAATLDGVTDPGISASLGPFLVNNYLPAEGSFGLGTYRSQSRFSFFRLEEYPG